MPGQYTPVADSPRSSAGSPHNLRAPLRPRVPWSDPSVPSFPSGKSDGPLKARLSSGRSRRVRRKRKKPTMSSIDAAMRELRAGVAHWYTRPLWPRVFPVVDNEAMGGRWQRYEDYFRFVQDQWEATSPEDRDQMRRYLAGVIELTGSEVFDGFPMTNKLVELRIIGRRHRADASVS